jgi:hypothetical protein
MMAWAAAGPPVADMSSTALSLADQARGTDQYVARTDIAAR